MTWVMVGNPGIRGEEELGRELMADAEAAAPPGVIAAKSLVLPRVPVDGPCRICGEIATLTKEHIPPRSSGNKDRARNATLDDWLSRPSDDAPPAGRIAQGGTWGYTLCADCNSKTGSWYAPEYQAWAIRISEILRSLPDLHVVDRMPHWYMAGVELGGAEDGGVAPGAFVRQVLAMMCSVGADWGLAERHPEIRSMILDKSTGRLPAGMSLTLHSFVGPMSRVFGPAVVVNVESRTWSWVLEVAHPPLATLMVLKTNGDHPGGLDISDMTESPPDERGVFEAALTIGFGRTPYPGDYRSGAAAGFGPLPAAANS